MIGLNDWFKTVRLDYIMGELIYIIVMLYM